jgi:hypothetical protein
MSEQERRNYHIERARIELDCSYRAENQVAAAAHMRLSALHMERARAASGPERSEGRGYLGALKTQEVNEEGEYRRDPLPAVDGELPTPLQECEGALQA